MIGGNYGLLQIDGDNIRVNPDFYAAHLFHRVMGDSILDSNVTVRSSALYHATELILRILCMNKRAPETSNNDFDANNIHQYVHVKGSTGSITVLILNFDREQDIIWNEYDGQQFQNIESWVATADDDQGQESNLNFRLYYFRSRVQN